MNFLPLDLARWQRHYDLLYLPASSARHTTPQQYLQESLVHLIHDEYLAPLTQGLLV